MGETREQLALAFVDRAGEGLEIGPSYSPIAPKRQGFRVTVADHTSADELRTKYRAWGLSDELLERIEDVDCVWSGEPLSQIAPGPFDFIVASHVLEHSVDLIGFLKECASVLKPGGTLSLVLPDKRFCFDILQPLSTVGQVLDAHLAPTRFHTPGTVLDHFAYAMTKEPLGVSWWPKAEGRLALQFEDWGPAEGPMRVAHGQQEYFDVHNWRFTPASFSLLLSDLRELGYTEFAEVGTFPTKGYEFFSSLRLVAADPEPRDRASLLARAQAEALAPEVVADVVDWAAAAEAPDNDPSSKGPSTSTNDPSKRALAKVTTRRAVRLVRRSRLRARESARNLFRAKQMGGVRLRLGEPSRRITSTPSGRPLMLIHVGTHKTGTTSVQQYCAANRGGLRRAGFIYPHAGLRGDQHALLPAAYMKGHPFVPERFLDSDPTALVDSLLDEVPTGFNVLLSSEVFWELLTYLATDFHDLHRLLAKHWDVRYVYMIREEHAKTWSAIKHMARAGLSFDPVEAYARDLALTRSTEAALLTEYPQSHRIEYDSNLDTVEQFLDFLVSPAIVNEAGMSAAERRAVVNLSRRHTAKADGQRVNQNYSNPYSAGVTLAVSATLAGQPAADAIEWAGLPRMWDVLFEPGTVDWKTAGLPDDRTVQARIRSGGPAMSDAEVRAVRERLADPSMRQIFLLAGCSATVNAVVRGMDAGLDVQGSP